jgi:hypothetical protein
MGEWARYSIEEERRGQRRDDSVCDLTYGVASAEVIIIS